MIVIKAVLFDLDNTLLDFVKFKTECIKESIKAMKKAGLKMNSSKAYDLMVNVYKKSFFESSTIFQEFLEESIGELDYKIIAAAVVAYRKVRLNHLNVYPNVKETLRALKSKKIKIGVITDAPKIKAWIRLTSVGLADYFNSVVALEDTMRRKPSTLPFRKGIKLMGVRPEEILFIGDNPNRDIKGARKVGMKTGLAKYGQFIEGRVKADYELNNIRDVFNYL